MVAGLEVSPRFPVSLGKRLAGKSQDLIVPETKPTIRPFSAWGHLRVRRGGLGLPLLLVTAV